MGYMADPTSALDQHRVVWLQWWASREAQGEAEDTLVAMRRLRRQAIAEPLLPVIDDEAIHSALYTMDDATGQGAIHDGVQVREETAKARTPTACLHFWQVGARAGTARPAAGQHNGAVGQGSRGGQADLG